MLMLNFVFKKKLASTVEIESLNIIELKCGLLGKVMEWREWEVLGSILDEENVHFIFIYF